MTPWTGTLNGGASLALLEGLTVYAACDSTDWETTAVDFSNPMTAEGDLIVGGAGGIAQRLAIGASGDVLTSTSAVPSWQAPSGGVRVQFGSGAPTGAVVVQSTTAGGYSLAFPTCVASGNLLPVAYKSEGTITGVTISDTLDTPFALVAQI